MSYYVYLLINPENKKPFYVGKGKRNRIKRHFNNYTSVNRNKSEIIDKLKDNGYNFDQCSKKLVKNLENGQALELEKFLIKEIGINNLTNITSGGTKTPDLKGTNHPSTKLSKKQVEKIKWLIQNTNHPHKIIASEYNISKFVVDDISTGKTWSHIDGKKPDIKLTSEKEEKRKRAAHMKWLAENTDLYQKSIAKKYDSTAVYVNNLKKERKRPGLTSIKPDWYEKGMIIDEKRKSMAEIKWLSRNHDMENKEIARRYQVSSSTVSEIKNNRTWKNVSPKIPNFLDD